MNIDSAGEHVFSTSVDNVRAKLPTLACEIKIMKFGITIKPDMAVERIVSLTRQAEAAGFEYGWIFDSHVLWLEPYPMLTLMAANTKRMRLGPCVTNPAVRDLTVTSSLFATLNLISGGRMQLGIECSASSPAEKKSTTKASPHGFPGPRDLHRCGLLDTDQKFWISRDASEMA